MASLKGIIVKLGNMGQTHWQRYRELNVDIVAVIEPKPLINCELVRYENFPEPTFKLKSTQLSLKANS